ncbi:MAG: S8 family serine peptidase [Anaerolineae bacterium]|nr:S8 family serine peptidase [Anaerolineae bacterium]
MLRQCLTSYFLSHQRGAKGSLLLDTAHRILRRNFVVLLIVSVLSTAYPPLPQPALAMQATAQMGSTAANRVIFKLRSATPARLAADQTAASIAVVLGRISSKLGAVATPLFRAERGRTPLKRQLGLDRIFIATLPPHMPLTEALAALGRDPDVEYAEPDFIGTGAALPQPNSPTDALATHSQTQAGGAKLPNDSFFGSQWGLNNTGQANGKAGAHINAVAAWGVTTGTNDILIGILDTGIDLSHPDLTRKIFGGYDFANNDELPRDDHGHGTHIAGIVGAQSNNGIGVAGVCWNCRMMVVKVLDEENRGYYSWWSSGIEYAVDHDVHAINMSMGGNSLSLSLQDAVRYAYFANVPILAAMMNEGSSALNYPAAFPEVIAVGMTNRNDVRDVRSSYGAHIHLVAPGTDIYSTMRGNTYALMTGTSMATPYVTGVVGLLYGISAKFTVEQIRRILQHGADDLVGAKSEDVTGWDQYYGHGRLNALKAVNYAQNSVMKQVSLSTSDFVPARTQQPMRADIGAAALIGPVTYTWEASDLQPFVDKAESNNSNVAMTWTVAGTKNITVTVDNGVSVVSATRTIEVFPTVAADFVTQPAPVQGPAPLSVTFQNRSTGDGLSYFWAFGDGATSTETNPSYVYIAPGVYSVMLLVTSTNGVTSVLRANDLVTVTLATATATPTATPSVTATSMMTSTPAPFEVTQLFLPVVVLSTGEMVTPTATALPPSMPTITATVKISLTPTVVVTKN